MLKGGEPERGEGLQAFLPLTEKNIGKRWLIKKMLYLQKSYGIKETHKMVN